ncbi:hypothetical protein DMA11_18390 [Marinilabiliaceae bacterium JC017]|nr:hypothetical protein DMA11_18390 [Marinilabiliaceae bacterium JC017]
MVNWISLIMLLLLMSCGLEKSTECIKDNFGKKIFFPKDIYRHSKSDLSGRVKIISCVNGDCPDCLDEMKLLAEKFHDNIIFIIHVSEIVGLEYYLDMNGLEITYYLDCNNSFVLKNDLLGNRNIQTFLLDENNEIILVGNPLFNEELTKLYQREIAMRTGVF